MGRSRAPGLGCVGPVQEAARRPEGREQSPRGGMRSVGTGSAVASGPCLFFGRHWVLSVSTAPVLWQMLISTHGMNE